MISFDRRDIPGIIIGVLLLALVLCVAVFSASPGGSGNADNGLGPGWSCETIPKAGPVCVKKVQPR